MRVLSGSGTRIVVVRSVAGIQLLRFRLLPALQRNDRAAVRCGIGFRLRLARLAATLSTPTRLPTRRHRRTRNIGKTKRFADHSAPPPDQAVVPHERIEQQSDVSSRVCGDRNSERFDETQSVRNATARVPHSGLDMGERVARVVARGSEAVHAGNARPSARGSQTTGEYLIDK